MVYVKEEFATAPDFTMALNVNMNIAPVTALIMEIAIQPLANVLVLIPIMVVIVHQFFTIAHVNTEPAIN